MRIFGTGLRDVIFNRNPEVTSIRTLGGNDHIELLARPADGVIIVSGGGGNDFISGGIPMPGNRSTLQVYGDDQLGPQGDDVLAMGTGSYNGRGGSDTYVGHGKTDAVVRNFNVEKDTLVMSGQRFDVDHFEFQHVGRTGAMRAIDVTEVGIRGIDRNPITDGQEVFLARDPRAVLGQERIEDGDNGGVFETITYNVNRYDTAADAFEAFVNRGSFDWFDA
jgi:hypothetical protein